MHFIFVDHSLIFADPDGNRLHDESQLPRKRRNCNNENKRYVDSELFAHLSAVNDGNSLLLQPATKQLLFTTAARVGSMGRPPNYYS